jgi:mono/diheme cytochrome c family protein
MTSSTLPGRRAGALLVLLLCSAAACDLPGKPNPDDKYVPPQKEMRFDVLYQQNCAGCHGTEGKYGPAPPLNDPLFLALVPHTQLKQAVTAGRELPAPSDLRGERPDRLMPAFATSHGGSLSVEQIRVLTEGIEEHWRGKAEAPEGAPPYLDTDTNPESAGNKDRGLKVFARACASCHGKEGQGGRYGGKPGGKLVGPLHDADFLALLTDQALRRYVITGRPDLGMPNYANSAGRPDDFKPLTARDVADVVALLASWRQEGRTSSKRD